MSKNTRPNIKITKEDLIKFLDGKKIFFVGYSYLKSAIKLFEKCGITIHNKNSFSYKIIEKNAIAFDSIEEYDNCNLEEIHDIDLFEIIDTFEVGTELKKVFNDKIYKVIHIDRENKLYYILDTCSYKLFTKKFGDEKYFDILNNQRFKISELLTRNTTILIQDNNNEWKSAIFKGFNYDQPFKIVEEKK